VHCAVKHCIADKTFQIAVLRIRVRFSELGAEEDYELVPYNPYLASDDERQWYVDSVHPHGTVPAMVVDEGPNGGRVMLESAAICMYLAELYGHLLPHPDMMPEYLESVQLYLICILYVGLTVGV